MNHVLFEVGLEELPARFIDDAEKQLQEKTKNWLQTLRIHYDSITTYSTPRRLAVVIEGIEEFQESLTEEVRGPSEEIAKDDEGEWSKAAIGFTKGQGKSLDDIYIKDVKDTPYIFVEKHIEGEETYTLLSSFKEIITSIHFPETMRWGDQSIRFSRPIRWLVALYNEQVIPFEIAEIKTNNKTFGHRFLGGEITLETPLSYKDILAEHYVIVDTNERESLIKEGIQKLERKHQFQVPIDSVLLNEVRNLVEYPTVFHGTFKEEFLSIPEEVLVTSMKEHQRYFPVQNQSGQLLPFFIGVRNGNDYQIENVVSGNEKVLQARLADGQFFYEEDQKHSIADFLQELKRVVFHEKVGTVHEKTKRVYQLAEKLATSLNFTEDELNVVRRSAEICKFDLVTEMVNEFPELQGVMGEKYALLFDEKPEVARAIREHYLPLQSEGELPTTTIGSVLSVADKLDTIVGMFSAGMKPTGSQDPYSLRRQAIGLFRIIHHHCWPVTIEKLLADAIALITVEDKQALTEEILAFLKLRVDYLMKEDQIEQDVIDAVLHNEIGIFSFGLNKAKVISKKRNDETFQESQEAMVRVLNLAAQSESNEIDVDPTLFVTDSEKQLYKVFKEVSKEYEKALHQQEATEAFAWLEKLTKPIHAFFEHNMVMVDDQKIKENRLSILNEIARTIHKYGALSKVQWKQ